MGIKVAWKPKEIVKENIIESSLNNDMVTDYMIVDIILSDEYTDKDMDLIKKKVPKEHTTNIYDHFSRFQREVTGIAIKLAEVEKETINSIEDTNKRFTYASAKFMESVSDTLRRSTKFILGLGLAAGIIAMVFSGLALILSLVFLTVVITSAMKGLEKTHKRRDFAKLAVIDMVIQLEELEKESKRKEDKQRYKAIRTELLKINKLKDRDIQKVKNMAEGIDISEDYNWDEMEFGLDAVEADYDDDIIDDVSDYDSNNQDEESEFYNYAIEKESYSDEEVDELIRRYMRIKDATTYQKIKDMIIDFRSAVKVSASKHGSFIFDTDEKDDEKDDHRIMTKQEAILIVDGVLASKYRTYALAFEHFRRDSAKTLTFSFFMTVFFICLTISGLVVLLPIGAVLVGAASIGNWYALFRDLKRTRLVIMKEIDRIDNTIVRLQNEPNPDGEKIKRLVEIRKSLIVQSGYDPKSEKWAKLRDPAGVKKVIEMIDYFGDILTADDIRINIMEAEADAKGKEEPDVDEEAATDVEAEAAEEEAGDNSEKGGEDTDGMDQEEYLDSNPLEETIEDNKGNSFDAGGSAKEEEYKLMYCLDNLDILHKKYSDLYDELISSDIYKIVNEDQNSKHRELLGAILTELNIAINNLGTYIEVGDKSTYPIVAVKLSTHQNILKVIDTELEKIVLKIEKDINK